MLAITQSPRPAAKSEPTKIYASLELSKSTWVVTSMSPGNGRKTSTYRLPARDMGKLLRLFAKLQMKARRRTGAKEDYEIVVIHEAGMDGFWISRSLEEAGIKCHVVDPASIPVPRRFRKVKTDRVDGEMLLRTLIAHELEWPRVCSMVRVPTVEQEEERKISRHRETLVEMRTACVTRIKSELLTHGIADYEPFRKNRWELFQKLRNSSGGELPEITRFKVAHELKLLEFIKEQIRETEDKRDELIENKIAIAAATDTPSPFEMLLNIKGIGAQSAFVLWSEGLFRHFDNRRQVASYAGLTPSPWKSGSINHVQGVSKSGNPRLRKVLIQLAWLWLRYQPESEMTLWFHDRVTASGGRRKRTYIVALARKLFVALWQYVTFGIVPDGVVMNRA